MIMMRMTRKMLIHFRLTNVIWRIFHDGSQLLHLNNASLLTSLNLGYHHEFWMALQLLRTI